MQFYQEVLHMKTGDPISLREQSTGLKYTHSLITHGPKLVREWISKVKPTTYQNMFTDFCHCTSENGSIHLVLIQQTHPEKGYTRSVTGNSVYGFSFQLSSAVDTDDLGWDLSIADISFEHGDFATDGTVYTPSYTAHSLYIRDPDGRLIELFPPGPGGTDSGFITRSSHVMLYVQDVQASIRFYQQTFGLTDITPDHIPRNPWGKSITWLGFPGEKPLVILYQVTNPDGSREKTGGYGLDHFALTGIRSSSRGISDPPCVTGHPPVSGSKCGYVEDPDGYIIEVTGQL
jgi:catechol 2,3-dioxygenase-like lactoylglutathione lyase family enzyme